MYDVAILSTGRTFRTCLVTVRQPRGEWKLRPDGGFDVVDAQVVLGGICFSCICTFKQPEPSAISSQEVSPQRRFASLLKSRPAAAWPPCPPVDIEAVVEAFPDIGGGNFPMVEMRKVDMSGFNAGRAVHERRELILYRLLEPLARDRPNWHLAVHAYEADRNGLLMAANHVGLGYNFGRAASLAYSLYVHVDAAEAVMEHGQPEEDVWWIQEVEFPRVASGRGTLLSKLWSPTGLHVATGYQDGIVRAAPAERL